MKKTFLSVAYCFMVFILSAQDLIYTVSADLNTQKTSLDSILIENLTNQTRILFDKLPVLDYYQINLSKNAFWGSVGVNEIKNNPLFTEQTNLPGNLAVSYNGNEPIEADLSVYNVTGMLVYSPVKKRLCPGNLVNIRIGASGVYFARIDCKSLSQTFKTIGSGVAENYDVTVSGQKNSGLKLKSVQTTNTADFSFTPGDSIRVSVYKNTYFTRPKGMKIAGAAAVNFLFEQSAVAIDGTSDAFVPLDMNTTNISSFDTITGTVQIQYSGNMPQLSPGDVIPVYLETSGNIRKVVKTTDSNGQLTVETVQAYLNDVFVDKEVKLHTGLMNPGVQLKSAATNEEISQALTDKDGYIHPVEIYYKNDNGQLITKSALMDDIPISGTKRIIDFYEDLTTDLYGKEGDNVHFFIDEGHVSLTSDVVFELNFNFDGELTEDTKIKKGDLKTFRFYLDSKAEFKTKLALDMSKSYEKADEKKLIDLEKVIAKFMVGAVPVWITFDCDIYGNYKFTADASYHADWGFEAKQTLTVGGTYDRKTDTFKPEQTNSTENIIYPLNSNGAVNALARMEIFPRVDVKFYDFFGPYAEIVPYVQGNYNAAMESQITQNGAENFLGWNSGVDVGLDFRTGTELTFLWGLFNKKFGPKTINCYEKPLWQSPTKIELLSSLPAEGEAGQLIPLKFKVSDLLGNPVALCPVYIKGSGTFSKQILFTDIAGEATADWTLSNSAGKNDFTAVLLKADKTIISEIANSLNVNGDIRNPNLEYITVEGGTFLMGSESGIGYSNEHPQHPVTLSSYKISKTEVTIADFIIFLNAIKCNPDGTFADSLYGNVEMIYSFYSEPIGYNGSTFYFKAVDFSPTSDCPAIGVTWYGANAFCKWVGGRLPTEAEWEYAALGGSKSSLSNYSGSNVLDDVAWYNENCLRQIHPVGTKLPNELGLFDMSGNAWEWCYDWSEEYTSSAVTNPTGPTVGKERVIRGGSYNGYGSYCRIARRSAGYPGRSPLGVGFRVARSL